MPASDPGEVAYQPYQSQYPHAFPHGDRISAKRDALL